MATTTRTKLQNFIDGEFVDPADGATEDVTNPANGEVIAEMPLSNEEDVNRAVGAAKRAFGEWSVTPPGERATALLKLADSDRGARRRAGRPRGGRRRQAAQRIPRRRDPVHGATTCASSAARRACPRDRRRASTWRPTRR